MHVNLLSLLAWMEWDGMTAKVGGSLWIVRNEEGCHSGLGWGWMKRDCLGYLEFAGQQISWINVTNLFRCDYRCRESSWERKNVLLCIAELLYWFGVRDNYDGNIKDLGRAIIMTRRITNFMSMTITNSRKKNLNDNDIK